MLAGLLYAAVLYYKDVSFADSSTATRRWGLPLLSLLRFISVTAIAVLLLTPLLRRKLTDVRKPYIIIAADNSESVAKGFTNGDTAQYAAALRQLAAQLGEQYEVETYHFGENLREGLQLSLDEKITDLSAAVHELNNRYANQNVGAVVLASDGIYNQGSNPLYTPLQLNAPLYTVALGDTSVRKDARIDRVLCNEIVYRGDKFLLRIDAAAFNAQGNNLNMSVYGGKAGGNKVFGKTIPINKNRFFVSEEVTLSAENTGIREYTVCVGNLPNEDNTDNNCRSVFVEVLEGKQKILLLANSPHPDLAAIKKAIERNKNYETTLAYPAALPPSLKDFNLVILHGLPSESNGVENIISQCRNERIPTFYILSSQTSVARFNKAQDVLQISGGNAAANDVKALAQRDFNLFTFPEPLLQAIEQLPPLSAPYGEYNAAPAAQHLLVQKIGTVSTKYPLMTLLQNAQQQKTAVLSGEGLWRWRMYDYAKNKNADAVDELFAKTVQYLAVKNDKRQFRVNVAKKLFSENETITFSAELYNDSYELINTSDVSLSVRNSEGKEYSYIFSKTGNAYTLEAGLLPAGDYSYTGRTALNGKNYEASGNFSIKPLQLETANLTANHQLLYAWSEKNGGSSFTPDQLSALADSIKTNPAIKPVIYSSYKTQAAINFRWIFAALAFLLFIEWFLRKYWGSY